MNKKNVNNLDIEQVREILQMYSSSWHKTND